MSSTSQVDLVPVVLIFLVLAALVYGIWRLRHRIRFRLSTIFWIITLAAVLLGWWADRMQLVVEIQQGKLKLAQLEMQRQMQVNEMAANQAAELKAEANGQNP